MAAKISSFSLALSRFCSEYIEQHHIRARGDRYSPIHFYDVEIYKVFSIVPYNPTYIYVHGFHIFFPFSAKREPCIIQTPIYKKLISIHFAILRATFRSAITKDYFIFIARSPRVRAVSHRIGLTRTCARQ